MIMEKWGVEFQVYRSLEGFPFPRYVKMETQDSKSYRCEGRLRSRSDTTLFVHTLSGRGIFSDGEGEHALPAGTGFLTKSGDPEIGWRFPEGSKVPWTFVWMLASGNAAATMRDGLIKSRGHIYSLGNEHPAIAKLLSYGSFKRLIHPLSPREGADMVIGLLGALAGVFDTPGSVSPRNLIVRQAQEMLLRGLESGITIAETASRFKLSREYFSHLFKEETGETPKSYLARQRVMRSCHLLKETRLSCKEIADRLGYENATNFSRAFKKALRITPREFRENSAVPLL